MTNSKTKKNKIIYVIATLILAMIFVIISSDQVFAGGNCFRHATQFKLNVEHEGRTRDCGAGDFYRFKTSPVKASYKFILYSLDNMYISVSLYDNNFNEVDYFSTTIIWKYPRSGATILIYLKIKRSSHRRQRPQSTTSSPAEKK